jgi:hypothetical protein
VRIGIKKEKAMSIPQTKSAVYILNTPILTAYGEWRFEGPLSVAQAREVLKNGFISAVGHQGAAEFLTSLLGIPITVQRIAVEMQPGDQALILRLKERLPETRVLTAEEMSAIPYELGLLTRCR